MPHLQNACVVSLKAVYKNMNQEKNWHQSLALAVEIIGKHSCLLF